MAVSVALVTDSATSPCRTIAHSEGSGHTADAHPPGSLNSQGEHLTSSSGALGGVAGRDGIDPSFPSQQVASSSDVSSSCAQKVPVQNHTTASIKPRPYTRPPPRQRQPTSPFVRAAWALAQWWWAGVGLAVLLFGYVVFVAVVSALVPMPGWQRAVYIVLCTLLHIPLLACYWKTVSTPPGCVTNTPLLLVCLFVCPLLNVFS